MGWKLEYDEDRSIIELILSGRHSQKDFVEAATARVMLGKQKNVSRFIINAEDIVAPRSQALDVISIPSEVYDANAADPASRVALLPAKEKDARRLAEFYETAAMNRGWLVRIFEHRDQAIAWLMQH